MTDKEQIEEMARELFNIKTQVYSPFTNKYDGKDKFFAIAEELCNKGYHKTMWHKISDGDLPKNANYVLVAYHFYSIVSYAIACYKGQLSNNFRKWSTTDDYFKHDDDVIAWTELPKYEE